MIIFLNPFDKLRTAIINMPEIPLELGFRGYEFHHLNADWLHRYLPNIRTIPENISFLTKNTALQSEHFFRSYEAKQTDIHTNASNYNTPFLVGG